MLEAMAEDSNELGLFLRSRREQLDPAEFGLPDSGRRRTPGLRREEVAALAGISMDYLIRLEQGRDHSPSPSVVGALANALRLDGDEQKHLAKLAACAIAPELCPRGQGEAEEVPDSVQHILDRLHPTPAVVLGPWYQVLAFNLAWERVMRPTGVLDAPEPNLARFVFTDERARRLFSQWEDSADEQVAVLREAIVRWRDDTRIHQFVDELLAVPDFADRWHAPQVLRRRRDTKVVYHPDAGDLHVDHEVLLLADDSDQRLVTWVPADESSADKIDRLVMGTDEDRRGGLRVVGS